MSGTFTARIDALRRMVGNDRLSGMVTVDQVYLSTPITSMN